MGLIVKRTPKEILSDRLLILWSLNQAIGIKWLGDTKAQKLAYLSELSMIRNRIKGFNYEFIKLQFGPYSEELQRDILWLEQQKLIDSIPIKDGKTFQQSRFGRKLLEDFHDMFIRNRVVLEKICQVNSKYGSLNTKELVDAVHHSSPPYNDECTIDDLEIGEIILFRLESDQADVEFNISPEELATLEVYLDDESYKSAIDASESAKAKPLLSLDKVF